MMITPTIELLNIDCMEYMATLPDKAFDLAVVDPPYGIGFDGEKPTMVKKHPKKYVQKDWDINSPDQLYFNELRRVSVNQIIWGANHFISKIPFDSSCWIIWDKVKGAFSLADGELAWTSFDTAVRIFKYQWHGFIQHDMSNKESRIHPTQKPVALYRWLLQNYASHGDRILDTHLGSGSSAIAAHKMGFTFVGCELDKDYYDASIKRFKEQTVQQDMFTEPIVKPTQQTLL